MSTRTATCACGQLEAICRGEPMRVSACHCLNCQRRSGSAFAAQARWPNEQVEIRGEFSVWVRAGGDGGKATHWFCPRCGSTIAYAVDTMAGVTAVPIGAFAEPRFPAPEYSVFENRKQAWVAVIGDGVEHFA